MIHFELILDCVHDAMGEAGVSVHSFAYGYAIVPVPFVEEIISFPH